jgi:hypothetical protein
MVLLPRDAARNWCPSLGMQDEVYVLLSDRASGIVLWDERHTSMDRCTMLGL